MAIVVEVKAGGIDVQGAASLLGGVSSHGIGTPNSAAFGCVVLLGIEVVLDVFGPIFACFDVLFGIEGV
jgi:hypothetical protein